MKQFFVLRAEELQQLVGLGIINPGWAPYSEM